MTKGIQVIRPHQRNRIAAQTTGMVREGAITPELTGSRSLWVGLVTTPPKTPAGWHHHGDCESAIYVVSGRGRFRWGKDDDQSVEVGAGDFLAVPPNTVHMEECLGDEPFVMVVARGCSSVTTVNVDSPEA